MPFLLPPHLLAPPALVAPAAPAVLRGAPLSPGALVELAAERRQAWRDWDPRPWWARPAWPDPPPLLELDSNQKVFLTQEDDLSDLRGHPGLNFVMIGAITGKAVRLGGAGTLAGQIVLRGASDDDSNLGAAYTELVNCSGALFDTGSTRCTLYRVRLNKCGFRPTGGAFVRAARFRAYGNLAASLGGALPFVISGVNPMRVDRWWYGTAAAANPVSCGVLSMSGTGWRNVEVAYGHIFGFHALPTQTGASIVAMVYPDAGEANIDYGVDYSVWLHHCLMQMTDGDPRTGGGARVASELIEAKCSEAIVTDNTIRYDLAGGPAVHVRYRHGERGQMLRNLAWYEGGGRGGGDIEFRGSDHVCFGNASLSTDGSLNAGTGILAFDGNIDADRWELDRTAGTGDNLLNCKRGAFAANAMQVVLANSGSATTANHPVHYNATACSVPLPGGSDANASVVDRGTGTLSDATVHYPYLLSDARRLQPLNPVDVGVALPN